MTEKYKILSRFIKDLSSETPNIETYLFVRDKISKYQLGIDINSKPLKNRMIEINTIGILDRINLYLSHTQLQVLTLAFSVLLSVRQTSI